MRSLSRWRCLSGSKPRTETCPLVRERRPSRISTVVVLPAPFGPSRPKTSPRLDFEVDSFDGFDIAVGLLEALHGNRWRSRTHRLIDRLAENEGDSQRTQVGRDGIRSAQFHARSFTTPERRLRSG